MINIVCLVLKSSIIQIDKLIKSLTVNSYQLIYYILKSFKIYLICVQSEIHKYNNIQIKSEYFKYKAQHCVVICQYYNIFLRTYQNINKSQNGLYYIIFLMKCHYFSRFIKFTYCNI